MKERVQKLMAQANIGSRRACEELIRQGRVRVNGQTIHLGDQADPIEDKIDVDGTPLKFENIKRYFAINKPINVLSANNTANYDDERTPVRELIPYEGHLFSIGRLDAESDGLMVLTNDGEMANMLTHPRYQHTKTYKVVVYGLPTQGTLDTWEKGVYLEEGLTAPCSIRVQQREADVTVLKIVMIEGKKRQIRRVAMQLGHPVKRLTRTHIGKLELGKMKHGEWYELSEEEVKLMATPASDLTYIRKLRREQREQRKQDFVRRSRMTPEELEADSASKRPTPGKSTAPSEHRYTPRLKEQFGRRAERDETQSSDRPRKPRVSSKRPTERDGEQSTERPPRRSSTSRPTSGRKPDRFNRDSEGDNTERPARRPFVRSNRNDENTGEQSSERPQRRSSTSRPATGGRKPADRFKRDTEGDNSERPARRPLVRSNRNGENTGEQSSERPQRRSSTSRPGAGGRKPADRFKRDTEGDNTERPSRRPFNRSNRENENENEQSTERPKRKPPISRTPKPRTGKPGTRNSRNKPPRKDRRIK